MKRTPVAVLISGRGSNMESLIRAAETSDYPARIVAVIANRPDAKGLDFAKDRGIPSLAIDHKAFPSREAFEDVLDAALREHGAQWVCLAGFMRVLSAGFVERWQGRMLNIHPSLLPDLKGLHTHRRALEAGISEHGCTVHMVVPELDDGPVLAQAKVPVLNDDTEESLAARVLEQEHRLYPQVLAHALRRGCSNEQP
jgi:phosphoribosylglycinamide formyltransferase 1